MENKEIKELRNDLDSMLISIHETAKLMQRVCDTQEYILQRLAENNAPEKETLNETKSKDPKDIEYEFPYVGFICRMCSSKLELVDSDKDCLTFECNRCSFEGRVSISHSAYKEVTWINVKL